MWPIEQLYIELGVKVWEQDFLMSQFTITFVFTGKTLLVLKLNWLIDSVQPNQATENNSILV